jgi:hypothetical protein
VKATFVKPDARRGSQSRPSHLGDRREGDSEEQAWRVVGLYNRGFHCAKHGASRQGATGECRMQRSHAGSGHWGVAQNG